MSTASRYCETACSARAGEPNALSVPGDSGKTRGHYDPRAARHTDGGGVKPASRSKREPEAEIAAFGVWGSTPVEYSGLRGAPLRHSPPFSFSARARPPPGTLTMTEG
jgi:hypothetical protein